MKKLFSFLLALVLMVGTITPVMADTLLKPGEKMIDVNVHKILMSKDDLTKHDSKKKYDPTKKIEDQIKGKTGEAALKDFFGSTAKEIDKVFFIAIKEGEDGYSDFESKTIDEKDTIIKNIETAAKQSGEVRTGTTTASGVVLKLISKTGQDDSTKYKIYEVKHKSTYVGGTEAEKKILAESKAVPVELNLPQHARTDTGIASEINVYPKNTEDGPTVEKKIIKNQNPADLASFDRTEEHTWRITTKIPTGLKDYEVFALEDTLQNSLSYVKGKVKVKVGTDYATATELTENTDYVLTEPTETEGGTLNVDFKKGISKLAASHEGQTIFVEFVTTINDNAAMSTDIPNEATLKYGHSKKPYEKKSNKPKVYTGGKKFKKIDSSQQDKALQGAEFVVKNSDGKYLAVPKSDTDNTKPTKYTWVDFSETSADKLLAATNEISGKDYKLYKLTSGEDGTFEIKGLEYDRPNGTKYKLVEVKAPKDYALPSNNEFEFTVNDTSYYQDATATQLVDADPQKIDNKPITIPETGGIGTVIFTVVGISLMAGAFIAMRKRTAEEN